MTIMVTGGAGFIGSNFVLDWIADTGETIINIDKLTYAGNRENLAVLETDSRHVFVAGEIENQALVENLLEKYHVRAVLNFAAESHVDRSILGPGAFIETNVVGTFKLLETAKTYWGRLDSERKAGFRFLHISTDEVFGSLTPEDSPFTETHPYRPNSPYSASKAASDHLVRAYGETYDLPVLISNCSNNYGPFHFPEKLIPLMIHNALTGKPLPVYGDGMQVRDWLYVKDHCSALRRILDAGVPREVYNVGGGNERSNLDVVNAVCTLLNRLHPRTDGKDYSDQITFVKDRPGHDRRYAIDSTKLRAELGWTPTETFESGLEKTVRWNLDNADWIERVTSGAYREWIRKQYA